MEDTFLPKITIADKQDAIDFLQSIKKTDNASYLRLIKRLKLEDK